MRVKQIVVLSVLMLSGFFVQAQQQFMLTLTERAFHVIPTENSGFYTLTHQVNCPDDHIVVRYFNRQGVLQASSRSPVYLGLISSIAAVCLPNNNLLLYLRDGSINHMLYEFDTTTMQLWNKNFQSVQPKIIYKKILPIPGSGFYLLGNYDVNSISDSAKSVLTRCSASGQPLWSKQYTMADASPSYVKFNDLQWEQGNLLAAGYHYRSGNVVGWAPKRPTWLKLDTAGNPIQAMYYMVDSSMIGFDEYEFMRLEPTPSGQYQALVYNSGNEHALIRLDSDLNIRWIKEKLSGRVQAFAVGYNDEVLLVPDGQSKNMFLALDSNGTFLSAHASNYNAAFHDNSLYGSIATIKRYDCGYLMANTNSLITHNPKSMAYCSDSAFNYNPLYHTVTNHTRKAVNLQAQTMGNFNVYLSATSYTPLSTTAQTWCSSAFTCGQPNSIGEHVHAAEDPIRIYPSLYTSVFNIETPNTEVWQLLVCDMQGRLVDRRELQGQTRYSVLGEYGAVGQYLVRLQQGEKVYWRRIQALR